MKSFNDVMRIVFSRSGAHLSDRYGTTSVTCWFFVVFTRVLLYFDMFNLIFLFLGDNVCTKRFNILTSVAFACTIASLIARYGAMLVAVTFLANPFCVYFVTFEVHLCFCPPVFAFSYSIVLLVSLLFVLLPLD